MTKPKKNPSYLKKPKKQPKAVRKRPKNPRLDRKTQDLGRKPKGWQRWTGVPDDLSHLTRGPHRQTLKQRLKLLNSRTILCVQNRRPYDLKRYTSLMRCSNCSLCS